MKKIGFHKKCIPLFLSLIAIILVLSSCSGDEAKDTTVTTDVEKATTLTTTSSTNPTTTAEPTEYNPFAVNPITGVQDMDPENVGLRSVTVVINNTYAALPARGVTAADAIYEYETEGGQTRLLALFADANKIPEIGSLRSARIAACDLSAGTNSIFIHYGKNARVPDHITSIGLSHLDGNNYSAGSKRSVEGNIDLPQNIYFWRDSDWIAKRDLEHTAVTNSYHILRGIEERGIKRDGETPALFSFDAKTEVLNTGSICSKLTVFFSNANDDSIFEYDAATKMYKKSEYGSPQIDETTGNQITVKNVVVLFTHISGGHSDGTVDIWFNEGGSGYYASEGKIIPITWSKKDSNSPIVLKNEKGEEISILPGTSYVNVVRSSVIDKTTWS